VDDCTAGIVIELPCELPKGHEGQHLAQDDNGSIYRWDQGEMYETVAS
jgi:hypothetical protein